MRIYYYLILTVGLSYRRKTKHKFSFFIGCASFLAAHYYTVVRASGREKKICSGRFNNQLTDFSYLLLYFIFYYLSFFPQLHRPAKEKPKVWLHSRETKKRCGERGRILSLSERKLIIIQSADDGWRVWSVWGDWHFLRGYDSIFHPVERSKTDETAS